LKQIADMFAAILGIERITVNPATGSVVICYDVDQHHEFHGHLQDHPQLEGSYCSSPPTEIDVLATEIEQEAEFLARHSDTARAIVDGIEMHTHKVDGAPPVAPVIVKDASSAVGWR
jgi:hypothetical protein